MADQHSSSNSDESDLSYRYSGSQSGGSPDSGIHSDGHDSDMSVDTVIIPSQSSTSDRDENDGLQVEAANSDVGGDLVDGVVDVPFKIGAVSRVLLLVLPRGRHKSLPLQRLSTDQVQREAKCVKFRRGHHQFSSTGSSKCCLRRTKLGFAM
ncbi:hypothetical protein L915_01122 [Phytophthora nicotianae]|uniref:Uncharacterized protein n=1 Tax=Phytophthora nicotianae TaxID=4792 RepID=W2HLB6_PHYNI|nr:hypothetical protein L915_01122 [Phytophthora nicotianae]